MEKKLTDEESVKALEHEKKHLLEEQERTGNAPDTQLVYITGNAVFEILDLIHRLQDENKRLTKENNQLRFADECGRKMRALDMKENAELQKQLEESKAENARLNDCVMSEEQVRKCCEDIIQDTMKKTVNDMGKEIYKRVTDNLKMWLRERYDVEVE